MPANEQTWRNIPLLHRVFAVSGVALFIATIWVLWNDQNREWRTTQQKVVDVDTTMNQWRQQQFKTDTATAEHHEKADAKLQADAENIDAAAIESFAAAVDRFNQKMEQFGDRNRLSFDKQRVLGEQQELARLAAAANAAWDKAHQAAKDADAAQRAYYDLRAGAKKDDDPNVIAARDASNKAQEQAQAADSAAHAASADAARQRQRVLDQLNQVVTLARNYENLALSDRKFKSAEVDAAKANVDIGVRDGVDSEAMRKLEQRVNDRVAELETKNLNYQAKNASRLELQGIVAQVTAHQVAATKDYEAALADLQALEKAYAQREEPYFVSTFPFLGKGILNLPILNAFNPPQKIENLWSEGLTQNYNFRSVRRFDRCTTCHQLMQRSIPGRPVDPSYIHERDLIVTLQPPEKVLPTNDSSIPEVERLEKTYGMRLAPQGLVRFDDVTISLVLPDTPAAKAEIDSAGSSAMPSEKLREHVAAFTATHEEASNFKVLPGLLPGDVVVAVEDEKALRGPARVADRLLGAVGSGKPLRLTIRRGMANPFTSHPRLDLFVGDSSPHPMGTFGCTICHEGQGNATAFKWASHTPNDGPEHPDQSTEWAREYGWFDNHHWIYPMWPKRFAESGCLKCHHDVVELEASAKHPEPPAATVTHGYHLIRKYGCYGCHEVNGYDGPNKRIGPDLRLEPNFFAAALQLAHLIPDRLTQIEESAEQAKARFESMHDSGDASADHATAEGEAKRLAQQAETLRRALELAPQIARRNFDQASRNELYQLFANDAAVAAPQQRAFTSEMHRVAAVLKDVEAPGALRKPGPTLRYVQEKLDPVFIYDWTNNPRNFRPSTRMPRFFGLWDHIKDAEPASLEVSKRLEPVEIHGIVTYLQNQSQRFVPIEKPNVTLQESPVEEQRERGKVLFETRGCLACHEHHDFPRASEYRGPKEIVQGPELSAIAEKFDEKRNPKGRQWLYSWIKDPPRYNVRTLMPNLYLDPIPAADGKFTDPAADIVEYLLDPAHVERANAEAGEESSTPKHDHKPWQPVKEASEPVDSQALKDLVIQYLRESFRESQLEDYYRNGLPERMRGELKVAEQDLVVPEGQQLTDEQRLKYIGRKSISKFGCYGCHDVPGFEDAKPIGTGLADWGRKDPSRLAFEHITHYLEHGHGGSHAGAEAHGQGEKKEESVHAHNAEAPTHKEEMPGFYRKAVEHGHRSGFIFQKLREPRSYDYKKTENKKYNDRLRMPEFPFDNEEREAVITFVLGLVAEPPTEKYLYKPNDQQRALIAGKQVLETFNCGGCHILEGERWRLSFAPGTFGASPKPNTFPFVLQSLDSAALAKSSSPDRRGLVEAEVHGLPQLEATGDYGGMPVIRDPDGADFEAGEPASPKQARYEFSLFSPAAVEGDTYQSGTKIEIPGHTITRKFPTEGGYLTKYLSPVVYQLERQKNPNAKGNEVYGWLPPPLMGEGKKVQTEWLYEFLMEPYAIRPATFLRMPKFNLSPDDTAKLVNYFAVRDGAAYPYEFDARRQTDHLASKQADYARRATEAGDDARDRLAAAMKTVTSRTYCVQCHSVSDYQTENAPRAQGPNLAQVYRRLRPDYLRRWIAFPQMILPYTPMPENVKYDPSVDQLSDKWYHGSRTDQVDGLVDLLMNFDEYAKRNTRIADLVPPAPKTPEATDAAEPSESGGQ
jgi:cytochrome c2